jgi:hypothetical protein
MGSALALPVLACCALISVAVGKSPHHLRMKEPELLVEGRKSVDRHAGPTLNEERVDERHEQVVKAGW